jgi:hypothetical protein
VLNTPQHERLSLSKKNLKGGLQTQTVTEPVSVTQKANLRQQLKKLGIRKKIVRDISSLSRMSNAMSGHNSKIR